MPARKLTRAALLLSVFVSVLSGLELKCTVSHDDGGTTYSLQEVLYDRNQKPEFSWFNRTKHVLANHRRQMEVVMNSSFKALTIKRCIEHILCEGHISSEGKPLDYSANCTTTCPEAPTGDKATLLYWIAAIVVVFLLLAGVGVFLHRRYVNLRNRSSGCRCFYTSVKTGNQNVEAGNDPTA